MNILMEQLNDELAQVSPSAQQMQISDNEQQVTVDAQADMDSADQPQDPQQTYKQAIEAFIQRLDQTDDESKENTKRALESVLADSQLTLAEVTTINDGTGIRVVVQYQSGEPLAVFMTHYTDKYNDRDAWKLGVWCIVDSEQPKQQPVADGSPVDTTTDLTAPTSELVEDNSPNYVPTGDKALTINQAKEIKPDTTEQSGIDGDLTDVATEPSATDEETPPIKGQPINSSVLEAVDKLLAAKIKVDVNILL